MEDKENVVYCDVLDLPRPPALPSLPPALPPRVQRPPEPLSFGRNPLHFPKQAAISQNNNRYYRNRIGKMNVALMFAVAFIAILSTVFAVMYFTIDKKDKACSAKANCSNVCNVEKCKGMNTTEPKFNGSSGIECPYGWTSLSSSCYFFSTTKTTWLTARDDCLKRGGDLVVPTNANEDTAIWKEVNQRKLSNPWIGISRSYVDHQFYTVYGSKVSYTNWRAGEPNQPKTEHCGSYWTEASTGAFGWNNLPCYGLKFHFICELQRTRS